MGVVAPIQKGLAMNEVLEYTISFKLERRESELMCQGKEPNAHRTCAAQLTVHRAS